MKAKIGNATVDAWQVAKDGEQPNWVQAAFDKKKIYWSAEDGVLRLVGGWAGGFAQLGDYLILNDKALSVANEKNFQKNYTPIK